MKKGCLLSIIFPIFGLIVFALIAPLIFQGADMRTLGQKSFPIIVIGGAILGFLIGKRKKDS